MPAATNLRKRRLPSSKWTFVSLLVAASLTATCARAADDSPWWALADRVFKPVAQNADLPHAVVPVSMTQGANGFLWLGGRAGLLRWDGYAFRDYPSEPSLPDGVRDTEITTLHRDTRGRLWAGTRSDGLARYEPTQDRLVCVKLAEARCGALHVSSITDDGGGGLWVATSTGLFRVDAAGNPIGQWHHVAGQATSLPGNEVLTVLHDRAGLWVGTRHGLARSLDDGKNFVAVQVGGGGTVASKLMEDSAGRLWIGTQHSGAYVVNADGRANIIAATAPTDATETAREINALLEITPGRIWIGTEGRGIVEVDSATMRTQRIVRDPFVPDSLDDDSIESLYRDDSGIIWIATEDGLSQYNPGRGIMTFFGHQGRADGLPGESVPSILAAPDGSIWAGLQGEGFAILDPAGRRAGGLAGHRVFAMALAPAGGVLLGTDGGLFLADPTGQRVIRLVIPGLSVTVDVRTLKTVGSSVWLGGVEGGLWHISVDASGNVAVLGHETAPRLTNSVVTVIGVAPDGRLAVGTNTGFNLLDPVLNAIERIEPDPANPHGLDAGLVGAFAVDRRGRLWVGTSNGLDILEGRDSAGRPLFRRLGLADGLPNAAIDSLMLDRRGNVWVATDLGLAMIDPATFSVTALQLADGLAITNYWGDSTAMTQDGELVFGGLGGITMIRPDDIPQWHYHPPVVFTAARIGGKPVPVTQGVGALLVVPADANELAVEFAALDFSASARNRYRYRLDGFDRDWINTDATHRVAAYTNLPPDDYTLRLLGSNRDGQWSLPETTLRVWVLPAWYQTFWFRLAIAIAAVVAVAALLRGWTAILRRRQRVLERQVADRTGELSVSKLQLQHANAVLELRVAERTQALVERTAALGASEARFRAWFNNAEDAVFVVQVEPDGRFLYEAVNAAVERIFGIAAGDFPARQPEAIWPADEAAAVLARYREAAKGAPIQFETHFAAPGGARLLDTWIVPLRHPITGRVERLVCGSRDMTDQRALEARLAQAQKLQALGGLAGGIAHDFNNILQAVGGAAMLIEQWPDDHDKVRKLARSTIAATERGTSITRRLLAFARSDELHVEVVPTAEVLDGLSDVLTYTLGSSITVRTAFANDLPPLLADRGPLETALVNLGTNARDAMPGGGTLTITAAPEQVASGANHPAGLTSGAYVRIEVADTGLGMDAATLTRVLEPFFTTKPVGQGTGLGLPLVKGFTEQSGGGMTIESTLGVGTIVRLWLRQAPADALQGPVAAPGARPTGGAAGRILVVDDDDLVRETMAAQLEGGGYSVAVAASGQEALAAIRSGGTPDAMVCDLSMPGMNGIETIKRARELLPGLPCFLLTGYAGEHAALEAGHAFTLLRKPISVSTLIAQIDAGLEAVKRKVAS